MCWGWRAASPRPPPTASCPCNAGLPVIFHPGCRLCPNEMFSYVPLIGLGPVQVSLFIQTQSPPCFHCSSLPPVLQDGCSSDPCSSLCSQPFCLREMGGFCPKARKKKKSPATCQEKFPWLSCTLGPGARQPRGLCCELFPKLPLHGQAMPGTESLGPSAALIGQAGQSKVDSQREYLVLELSMSAACVRHRAALNSLLLAMKLLDSNLSLGIALCEPGGPEGDPHS